MDDSGESEKFEEKRGIDKVRASKAGHAYHEAWAARSALELLPPSTTLVAITLEGFSREDEVGLDAGAVEIADLVRYHGSSNIARATLVEIVQFKYSIANDTIPVRAVDIAKTLKKFAHSDVQLRRRNSDAVIEGVVRYDFATNRPINENLLAAIEAIRRDDEGSGDVAKQVTQLKEALKDYPLAPRAILDRLSLSGSRGSLKHVDTSVRQILAGWGEASDPESEKRLLKLRNLVRNKAGPDGEGDNRINRISVLAELEVDHEEQLYPTPDAFPPVAHLISRPLVDDVAELALSPGPPLIVHAAGGMGKTVLMQAVAERLRASTHVITFDGFGAGKWRDPADGRHRPERTLVHLANLLAGQGLCDILLPIYEPVSLLRAFRRRLEQAVATARQASDQSGIVLVLDAIDHAAIAAEETGSSSFAHLLLQTLGVNPVDGVTIIGSCRTEHLDKTVAGANHREFEVPAFTPDEARELILARVPNATDVEIAALEARSGRNPRCLDTFLVAGRPFELASIPTAVEATPAVVLDALLRKRVADAREAALVKGAKDADVDLLLTSLSILPPPVPVEELAAAHGMPAAQVESFVADLTPLLERTSYGLMFRDEPTETLIRGMSAEDQVGRDRIVGALSDRQSVSNYAARALPAVLTALKFADQLVVLAFDDRAPPGASKVGQRDIRLSRIVAALEICGRTHRHDDLLRVLLEASIVAAGHERSDRFLYEHPDLAAASGDSEALRRLFATKAGWPGGRHSALALAYAFSGENGEARRNGRRAIDWHNWASSKRRHPAFSSGRASEAWDDIGFTYVELLAGNDIRIALFFDGRSESEAYGKFSDLLDLLERNALIASEFPTLAHVRERIDRCRLRSRALYAAALVHSDGYPSRDRQLIKKFAASTRRGDRSDEFLPSSAVLAVAVLAVSTGLRREARTIIENAKIIRPRIHDYSSYWPMNRDSEHAVILAGLKAVLRGRPATLLDLAPIDLLELVPMSVRRRGPKAFEEALNKRLVDQRFDQGSKPKRRRKSIGYEDREKYRNALQHRINPLIPHAHFVTRLVSAPTNGAANVVLMEALDALENQVAQASDYPYRDGKSYLAKAGFSILFAVADAIGAIDGPTARHMADWLSTAPGFHTPQLVPIIARLSRRSDCHDAALKLAAHVEALFRLETDISTRISSYGELARAVWRVSADEAAAYFRRALDLADAIGSDEFDRTNHLLELTSHYHGRPLNPAAGHDLARILELNQSDEDKFPWIEYAQTMVPVAGVASLAMISRLDDRGTARFGLTIGPVLTELASSSVLPPDLATSLFGLAAPIESRTWRYDLFVKAALEHLPADQHEWLFEVILIELDRVDQLSPWRETITDLVDLAENHLDPQSPSLARLHALKERRGPPEAPPVHTSGKEDTPAFEVDFGNPDAIDAAIESEEADQSGNKWPVRTLLQLAAQITTPVDRLKFVSAVIHANAAKLSDKLHALDDYLPGWSAKSAALRDALPGFALILAAKHAAELVGHSWESMVGWRELTKTFNADRAVIVEQVVASLGPTATDVSGDSWLALAAQIAPCVGSNAFAEGLERFLRISGATLPEEVVDGPWNEGFSVNSDPVDAVAGLLWFRLGHHRAAARWRAAHAVRRLASAERFDVIVRLVSRFDDVTAHAFGDAKLPFYPMHARLWLLIALARIAIQHPKEIVVHRELLERVAFDPAFPHVVMRAFAADALRAIIPALKPTEGSQLRTKVDKVNKSPFEHQPRTGFAVEFYQSRPDDHPRPSDEFHLDYDFNKYQTNRLSETFGCAGWEIEDLITRWVRGWDVSIHGMYDCPRVSSGRDYEGSWSSGYVPDVDRYGGYLGWHALMLAAGEFLQTRKVTGHSWDGDAWGHFLSEYTLSRADGLWLADVTDLFPLDLSKASSMPDKDRNTIDPVDHEILAPMIGVAGDTLTADWMVVSGSWSLPDDVTMTVRTIIADRLDAETSALTMLTDPKFFRWLPDDEHEVRRHFQVKGHTVRAWVEKVHNSERQLDRRDPYASPTAMSRPKPDRWVIEEFGLSADDNVVRRWVADGDTVFHAEAWGAEGGRGEGLWDRSGERIAVSRPFLLSLLRSKKARLVCAVKAQKYHRDRSLRDAGGTNSFTHRSSVFTINHEG